MNGELKNLWWIKSKIWDYKTANFTSATWHRPVSDSINSAANLRQMKQNISKGLRFSQFIVNYGLPE